MSFAKVPRAILKHPISHDAESLSVFIHMILGAAWEDKTITFNGESVSLKRGQLIYGRQSWSQKTGLSEAALRRSIRRLKKWQLIGDQTSHRYSIITLLPSDLWREVVTENGTTKNIYNNNNNITRQDAKKPSFPEVNNTIKAKKIKIDAEDFFNYYDARGWALPNGQPIVNWISLAYSWAKRDKDKADSQTSWEVVK